MSSSEYILLLFLFFSLHACNARRHPSSLDKMEKKPHFSLKIVEKNGFDSSLKKVNEGDNKMKTQIVDDSEKPKHRRNTNERMLKGVGKISIGLQSKSQVSVSSWRVPHKKHSEKHPGFNLDYSPPKTHPPSHN
ncbi:unnamed protein product [Trifolium pratense]|uniref:Uncharacterized protein n=1 Tax=Trifolium pratense TaxID=57577 RepID=A0ACB0KIG2_TRIPR|nr:unnamed protein product [Trifolium pratense]